MIRKNLSRSVVWAAGFAIALVFITGLVIGKSSRNALSAENDTYEDLKVFTEVLSLTQKNYVDEVDPKELIYGAIRGMLGTLDPHSVFMTPDMYKEVQVDTKGEFGGLGIQIGIKDGRLTVISPIEDTPAFRAGILAGDWIWRVDDLPTGEMSLMEAVQKMRGPRGTNVVLTIRREGAEDPVKISVTRDIIRIDSVKSRMLEDSIGYVRITQFQERTGSDLESALREMSKSGMKSLVLDLRNNPGGLLKSALEVSEQFLPPGKLIVFIKGRDGKKDEYLSTGHPAFEKNPMIILVNGGSASASEIVSGALQDWGRAVILGTTSFGKGSVQTILPLSDNSGLRLTTARYYTPKGRSIHGTGINPDIVVETEADRKSPPLREKDLQNRDPEPRNHPPIGEISDEAGPEIPETAPEGQPEEQEDIQLNKAVELLKTWEIFKEMKVTQDLDASNIVKN